MKYSFCIVLLILSLFFRVSAQVGAERNPFRSAAVFTNLNQSLTKNVTYQVNYYKSDVQGMTNDIPIGRITGNVFCNIEWKLASLYDINNKCLATIPVKLNLNTHTVHYLNEKNEEMAVDNDYIRKVLFHKDSTEINSKDLTFMSFIPYVYIDDVKINDYLQVMNQGNCALLKYARATVMSADSAFGTQKRYFFKQEKFYFLQVNGKIERLKKVTKDEVLKFLPGSKAFEDWVKENNINLKKEDDVVKFIDYYNSKRK
jgi:hypothetical protein